MSINFTINLSNKVYVYIYLLTHYHYYSFCLEVYLSDIVICVFHVVKIPTNILCQWELRPSFALKDYKTETERGFGVRRNLIQITNSKAYYLYDDV